MGFWGVGVIKKELQGGHCIIFFLSIIKDSHSDFVCHYSIFPKFLLAQLTVGNLQIFMLSSILLGIKKRLNLSYWLSLLGLYIRFVWLEINLNGVLCYLLLLIRLHGDYSTPSFWNRLSFPLCRYNILIGLFWRAIILWFLTHL